MDSDPQELRLGRLALDEPPLSDFTRGRNEGLVQEEDSKARPLISPAPGTLQGCGGVIVEGQGHGSA